MSKLNIVLLTSSLLLVAGQAAAAPSHLPRVGRTSVEHRLEHPTKAHTSTAHHSHHKHHKM
jgi:hypothetical protein